MVGEQFVEVKVGREKYAFPILKVHEIIRMMEITELPHNNHDVLGVINLRGKIISVVSLRRRLGLSDQPHTKATRIVVVNFDDSIVGMVVDSVNQVISFSELQPPPAQVSYITGIGNDGNSLVNVLKLEPLLQEIFG